MDGYKKLANAIVMRAVKDYRQAIKKLKKYPDNKKALQIKKECEKFFTSTYFTILTGLDGEALLEKLA